MSKADNNYIRIGMHSLATWALLLYFFSILLLTQVSSPLIGGVFYGSIVLAVLLSIISMKTINMKVLYLLLGVGILGTMNILLVGNIAALRLALILGSVFASTLFIRKDASEMAPLIAFIANALVVLYHFARGGISGNVYVSSSNNYISVYLIATLVMYYTICERHKKRASIIPSLAAFIISFLSGSRGGFLSCAVLFAGLMIYRYFTGQRNKWGKRVLVVVLLIVALMVGVALIPSFLSRHSNLRVISRFTEMGLDGAGRWQIWGEYISSIDSIKDLLLGSRLDGLFYMEMFNKNLHNSMLFIHAYFGIFGIVAVLFILARNFITSIKNKKYIYALCLVVFVLRGLTDHVFGGHRLTVVFLYLLLFPILMEERRKKQVQRYGPLAVLLQE